MKYTDFKKIADTKDEDLAKDFMLFLIDKFNTGFSPDKIKITFVAFNVYCIKAEDIGNVYETLMYDDGISLSIKQIYGDSNIFYKLSDLKDIFEEL